MNFFRIKVFALSLVIFALPQILEALPGLPGNPQGFEAIQLLGADANACENCHDDDNNNLEFGLNNNDDVIFKMFDRNNTEITDRNYLPGETYTIEISVPDVNVLQPTGVVGSYYQYFRARLSSDLDGELVNFDADASDENDNDGVQTISLLRATTDVNTVNLHQFDWIAPASGKTVTMRIFMMNSNNDGENTTDQILDGDTDNGEQTINLLGPISGTPEDLPDLLDGGSGSSEDSTTTTTDSTFGPSSAINKGFQSGGCRMTASSTPPAFSFVWILALFLSLFAFGRVFSKQR